MLFPICIPRGQQSHFLVEVPVQASVATNTLTVTGAGVAAVYYSALGVPDGNQPGDVLLIQNATGTQQRILTTKLQPILPIGQRYYLTVEAGDPDAPGTGPAQTCVQLQVDFGIPVVNLRADIPYDAISPNLGLMDFYSFVVPTNALQVEFAVTNANTEVTLVARRATLPSKSAFDYISENPGLADERIFVGIGSEPVRLAPGPWYLGVYPLNRSLPIVTPVTYSITAKPTLGVATP